MNKSLKLFTDGGSRGNPGPAGFGFVVYDSAENILEKCGNYLGITTNNQAEYAGLEKGIAWIVQHYSRAEVEIFMDSLLIVNQVKGLYKVKNQALLPPFLRIKKLLRTLPKYTITHIPREHNAIADSLANEAMDRHQLV